MAPRGSTYPSPGPAERSFTDETVSGVAWQSLSIGATIVIKAAILILLARSLPAEAFGIVAAAAVVTSVMQVFSQIGVSRMLVQRLTLLDDHIRSAFAISLYTGAAATAGVYMTAPWISEMFRMDDLDAFVRFMSFTLLINSIGVISAALLQRERRFRTIGLIEVGTFVFGFGFVALPLAAVGAGAWSLAIGEMVHVLGRTAATVAVRRPLIGFWPRKGVTGELLRVGSGFSAGQVGNFVALQIDNLIVGRWLGAEALGLYSRAYQFLVLPAQLFGTAAATVLFPSLSTIQDQPERVARAYVRALGVVAMLTLPVSGVLMILAPELVAVALGSRWTGMTVPFQILAAALLFRTSYKISDSVSLAMGSMYERAWRQWIYAAAVAAGALSGMQWGVSGVAAGVSAAVFLNFALMSRLALRITKVPIGPIIRLHLRHFGVALITVVPVLIAVTASRYAGASNIAVLGAGSLTAAAASALLWSKWRSIFGPDGAWLHEVATIRMGALRRSRRADSIDASTRD